MLSSYDVSEQKLGFIQHHYLDTISYLQRARKTALSLGDHITQSQALTSMGVSYAQLGRMPEAILCLEEGLSLLSASTEPTFRADALLQLAEVRRQMGDIASARRHLEEAAELYVRLGDDRANQIRKRIDMLEVP